MTQQKVDLANLFQATARNLAASQDEINHADNYNGNHGANMVHTFQTIASALEKKRGSSASAALNYAAREVNRKSPSGSGQIYAQNLARAASQFKGRQVDQRGALDLLQILIGGGQQAAQAPVQSPRPPASDEMLGAIMGGTKPKPRPSQGQQSAGMSDLLGALMGTAGAGQQSQGGDLLGSLLGGMGGSQQAPQASSGSGDLLGSLLGGLGGQQPGSSGGSGLDMGDLLTAGLAFMQAKQSGGSTMQALVQAFMAGSGMGRSPHREQSTQLVVNSFLQALAQGA